jgi:hypothetical protein
MAKKTSRKLALRTETLRQLNNVQLSAVVGGVYNSTLCDGNQNGGNSGSTFPKLPIYDQYTRIISWQG